MTVMNGDARAGDVIVTEAQSALLTVARNEYLSLAVKTRLSLRVAITWTVTFFETTVLMLASATTIVAVESEVVSH